MSSTPLDSEAQRSARAAGKRVEAPSEYIRRLLSYLEGKEPWSVLEATPDKLRTIVRATPPAVLRRVPAPGKWSPAQIITHLADSEIVASYRIRMIIAQNGTAIQAFDQDEWATKLSYEAADPQEQVNVFAAARSANLALLRRVDPRLHENHGMHAERGRETVSHLIRLYAGHDLNHLQQLDQILG